MSKLIELEEALKAWRRLEKTVDDAVLGAYHPDRIAALKREEQIALHHIRSIVDSEPWAEMQRGE